MNFSGLDAACAGLCLSPWILSAGWPVLMITKMGISKPSRSSLWVWTWGIEAGRWRLKSHSPSAMFCCSSLAGYRTLLIFLFHPQLKGTVTVQSQGEQLWLFLLVELHLLQQLRCVRQTVIPAERSPLLEHLPEPCFSWELFLQGRCCCRIDRSQI